MAKPKVANPSDPVMWCKKAAELLESDDLKGAAYCYEESLKLRPGVADVWFNLACIFEKMNDKNAALGAFASAQKVFASDFRFPAERARILAQAGKYKEAVECMDSALEINPYSALLHSNKAGYLIFDKDAKSAVEEANKALEIEPSFSSAFLHKAHALIVLGDCEAAKSVLEEGLSLNYKESRLMKMKANLLVRTGGYEEAACVLDEILLENAKDDEAWSLKGAALANIGDKEGAVAAFDKAMEINPKNKSYKANRSHITGKRR